MLSLFSHPVFLYTLHHRTLISNTLENCARPGLLSATWFIMEDAVHWQCQTPHMGKGISKVTHSPPLWATGNSILCGNICWVNLVWWKCFVGWIKFNPYKSPLTHSMKNTYWTVVRPGYASPLPPLLETYLHGVCTCMCYTHFCVIWGQLPIVHWITKCISLNIGYFPNNVKP